jgi:hypothetical protein
MSANALLARKNVHGTARGTKIVGGVDTGIPCLTVFVEQKEYASALAASDVVPSVVAGLPTDVIVAAPFVAPRPPPIDVQYVERRIGGTSIGHYKITAGTWGIVVFDDKTNEPLILSNNHVLSASNNAHIGDYILSPGAHDGGIVSRDAIGELARFERIYFAGDQAPLPPKGPTAGGCSPLAAALRLLTPTRALASEPHLNMVDCALARFFPDEAWLPGIDGIGAVQGVNENVGLGLAVKKSGRTTGLTQGTILYTDATIDVSYGSAGTARFSGQLIFKGNSGDFSLGGDSGSLIVDDQNRAVALLFAGSTDYTVANPITEVMAVLNIRF